VSSAGGVEFCASQGSSLGVEMELSIVDKDSRDLRSAAIEILDRLGHDHPKAKHELFQSTLEVITGICSTVSEAKADLRSTLDEICPVIEEMDLALMCSGTHPFARWHQQDVSPKDRYHHLIDAMQWPARRLQICGIHVHVGVRSGDKAIAIANALCAYIPHFLAISASSPYWEGHDTGLASVRSKVFESMPTAGIPHQLGSWEDFEQFLATLINAKAVQSIREVWWDIRPHPGFGTVELRMCDGLPTLREVAAVAALAQSLVEWMDSLIDRGYSLPMPSPWVTRENKWRAGRHGIDADILVNEQGDLQPVAEAIRQLVEDLSPVARRLGCEDELVTLTEILQDGPSYVRQRAVIAGGGTTTDVVDLLVEELRSDRPAA
jgi:glutamate---cysteine ligase / carboxylate-amine ligase